MYHIEINYNNKLGWHKVPFAEHKNRCYCDGYLDALDSRYPSDPARIIKTEKDGSKKIIRETKGHGKVHTN